MLWSYGFCQEGGVGQLTPRAPCPARLRGGHAGLRAGALAAETVPC